MLSLALRLFLREWRAGKLYTLMMAIVVAVASLTAVSILSQRIERAMENQSGELLAADRVVAGNQALSPKQVQKAERMGLQFTETVEFRSVVVADGRMQLTEVKAVEAPYPLRGELRITSAPFAPDTATSELPEPGSVWVEARLLQALGLELGDTIKLGKLQLPIEHILSYEPDRGGRFFSIAPRVLMNRADVEGTGLLVAGSLQKHRLLLKGAVGDIDRYQAWLEPQLPKGYRWLGGRDSREEIGSALERAGRFLGLASIVSLLLAAAALVLAARRYASGHLQTAALLRTFGAGHRQISQVLLLQILAIGLLGSLLGIALGYLAHGVLLGLLEDMVQVDLPPLSLTPVGHGLAIGLIMLVGFALPPILATRHTPAMHVLRREAAELSRASMLHYPLAFGALVLLMQWLTHDWRLTLYMFVGSSLALGLFAVIAWLLLKALHRARFRGSASWRFGVANLYRRSWGSVMQIVAFGLGLMVLLLLAVIRNDLLETWQQSLPVDAPNHFLINIQGEQLAELESFFSDELQQMAHLSPMVKGRLVQINEQTVSEERFAAERAKRLVRREFNLSWAGAMGKGNTLVEGAWWSVENAPGQWSVEKGLADELGIKMGDTLHFMVQGTPIIAKVSSLREVRWDSFEVNFFVQAPPGLLPADAATYITSFYLPAEQKQRLNELVERFPNITVVDVDAIMQRVRGIIDKVATAVGFVFLFTLLAGVVVMFAAIQSTQDDRRYETGVLRAMGASRAQVRSGLIAEFMAMGLLAGTLAAIMASMLAWVLAEGVFQLDYTPSLSVWLYGPLGGAVFIALLGYWGNRSVLQQPPVAVLKGAL